MKKRQTIRIDNPDVNGEYSNIVNGTPDSVKRLMKAIDDVAADMAEQDIQGWYIDADYDVEHLRGRYIRLEINRDGRLEDERTYIRGKLRQIKQAVQEVIEYGNS